MDRIRPHLSGSCPASTIIADSCCLTEECYRNLSAWDQLLHDTITTLAVRAGLSRPDFLQILTSKANTIMTWTPPQPKPWWKFWGKGDEEHQPVVEAEPRPQLPG